MRILVTGKNGQLGRSIKKLVSSTEQKNHFIFVGRKELDLSQNKNIENYLVDKKINIIINCAAYTAVDRAEGDNRVANQINHVAVAALATFSQKHNIKLIHISTDYVFDGESDKPYAETDITKPINTYGRTKLAGEKAIQEIMPLNGIIVRTSWVYSEYGNNFVDTMLKLGSQREDLRIVSDQVGCPTYATDLAEVLIKITNNKNYRNKNWLTKIYHYSNEGQTTWYEFAKEIFQTANIDCKLTPLTTGQYPTAAKRPRNTVMKNSDDDEIFKNNSKNWKKSLHLTVLIIIEKN